MSDSIRVSASTRGASATLASVATWYSLATLLAAAGYTITSIRRVKLVAPQTFTEKGAANTSPVKIGVLNAAKNAKVATDYLAADGSRDQWIHREKLDETFLKPGTNNDGVELTIEM